MTKRIFAWPKSRATSLRKSTQFITVHCSATPEGKRFDATDLDSWHLKQGWAGIGYHFVVQLDGSIEAGRPEGAVGSHVAGYNGSAIGAVYIGGVDRGGQPADTRTPEQQGPTKQLLRRLQSNNPGPLSQTHQGQTGRKDR